MGGTGLVGGYIVEHLVRGGERPLALVAVAADAAGRRLVLRRSGAAGDVEFPAFATLYCTADAVLLANALPRLFNPSLKRVIVFSSTSVLTKLDTEVVAEREMISNLADAEQKNRSRLRTTQCRLDDIAPHADLRRGPRYQYHASVAADPPVWLHAAGRRRTGFAPTGACRGSGDRSHRRGIESCCRQQDLFAAGRRRR